jgi:hypothetical protein
VRREIMDKVKIVPEGFTPNEGEQMLPPGYVLKGYNGLSGEFLDATAMMEKLGPEMVGSAIAVEEICPSDAKLLIEWLYPQVDEAVFIGNDNRSAALAGYAAQYISEALSAAICLEDRSKKN